MEDILEKLIESMDTYKYNVDLSVYIDDLKPGEEESTIDKVQLEYDIEVEHRSWGIKSIVIIPRGVIEFEVDILDADDNIVSTIPVKIDFNEIEYSVSWLPGGSYVADHMEVSIDRDGKIKEVDLSFYYITKE